MSRDLLVHYKRKTYLVQITDETRALSGTKRQVEVHEGPEGRVEIQYGGLTPSYVVYDSQPYIPQGEIVENKRLGAVLAAIHASHEERDTERLVSKKLTLRQKGRLLESRVEAKLPVTPVLPAALPSGLGLPQPVAAYLARFREEQRLKRKRQNDVGNERKRQREVASAPARSPMPGATSPSA